MVVDGRMGLVELDGWCVYTVLRFHRAAGAAL